MPFCVMVNASDVLKSKKNISRFKSLVIDFKNSKLSLIRIACYFKELDKVNELVSFIKSKKIKVAVNLMQINLIKKKFDQKTKSLNKDMM